MKELFISYTSKDREVAEKVVEYLEEKGISCFIAPRDIEPGTAYASALIRALNDCAVVLLVASNEINNSEYVLNEIDAAVEKKKPVLTVFIEDFGLNDDYRFYLGRKQWVICYPEKFGSYLPNIYSKVRDLLPTHTVKQYDPGEEIKIEKTKIFEYVPKRGIMINPEDHQRNVSFRTDTLINLMGEIYDKVGELVDAQSAENIFYSSGYTSGKNFADRINNQWDTGHDFEEMEKKVNKWCQFDSSVGWGNFSAKLAYADAQDDSIIGTLKINEAILVDKNKKRRTCSFIKGYCTGVLESLLDENGIELVCKDCPLQNRFKCVCEFDIMLRG